ncbi:MAG: hypothetical protein ACYSUV_17360 [Planctomycetota bacterium]|jgi:hypothetical protein
MKSADNIRELIKGLCVQPDADADKKIHDGISQALEEWEQTIQTPIKHNIGRIIMKSQITKFAAAAAIIIVAGLLITFLGTGKPLYALEQTIQASHSIRYIHTKSLWPPHEEPMEAWIEFDATGAGRRFRIQMPAWTDPWGNDGAKIIVWKDNKAHIFLRKKNFYFVSKDNEIADMVFKSTEQFDPKTTLIGLQLLESQGKVDLDIDPPDDKAQPIIVTATILEEVTEETPMTDTERAMKQLSNMWKGSENEISIMNKGKARTTVLIY